MQHYKFVQNKECEFFPCHKLKEDQFNCLFCYCPLFPLKDQCHGNPTFLEDGTKSCMNCALPHVKDKGYEFVMSQISRVLDLGKQ